MVERVKSPGKNHQHVSSFSKNPQRSNTGRNMIRIYHKGSLLYDTNQEEGTVLSVETEVKLQEFLAMTDRVKNERPAEEIFLTCLCSSAKTNRKPLTKETNILLMTTKGTKRLSNVVLNPRNTSMNNTAQR